jgi:hypothetical protein
MGLVVDYQHQRMLQVIEAVGVGTAAQLDDHIFDRLHTDTIGAAPRRPVNCSSKLRTSLSFHGFCR